MKKILPIAIIALIMLSSFFFIQKAAAPEKTMEATTPPPKVTDMNASADTIIANSPLPSATVARIFSVT